jgi:hypothetical protein
MNQKTIPSRVHFVWIGESFPFVNLLAARSAAARGGFGEIVIHHTDTPESPFFHQLEEIPGARTERCDPADVFGQLEKDIGDQLHELFKALDMPAAKCDVLRTALLYIHGGVYMDFDTLSLSSFDKLLENGDFFCGNEHSIYPGHVRFSWDPRKAIPALVLQGMRGVCYAKQGGWMRYRSTVEPLITPHPNNAILGCAKADPFVESMLRMMAAWPRKRSVRRCALGPHLLQEAVATWLSEGKSGIAVLPPSTFYPLGPVIAQHWFALGTATRVDDMLYPDTMVRFAQRHATPRHATQSSVAHGRSCTTITRTRAPSSSIISHRRQSLRR